MKIVASHASQDLNDNLEAQSSFINDLMDELMRLLDQVYASVASKHLHLLYIAPLAITNER